MGKKRHAGKQKIKHERPLQSNSNDVWKLFSLAVGFISNLFGEQLSFAPSLLNTYCTQSGLMKLSQG